MPLASNKPSRSIIAPALSGSAKSPANGLRTPKQRAGEAAEAAACELLAVRGCRIVARNIRYREGELDIVVWDGSTLAFVEVRLRRDARFGGAAASVDVFKRKRLARAARHYLAERFGADTRRWPPCRFDVVAADAGGMEWLRDAFGETD